MRKYISGIVIAMFVFSFLFMPSLVQSEVHLNDLNMLRADQYSLEAAFSVTGPSKILVGGTMDPLVTVELENFLTLSFISFGILGSRSFDGTESSDANLGVDLFKYKKFRFGTFKPLDNFSFGKDFIKNWNFMAGLGWEF